MIESSYDLASSMCDSITRETSEIVTNIGEIGFDLFFEDGFLKEIPFISTAVSLFRIGSSIHDIHNLKKLWAFVQGMNQGISNETQRESYKNAFLAERKKRNNEIEYLIVIIDRYVGMYKPRLLAKVFLSYLDNLLSWQDVCKYAEVIDRFLPGDFEVLCSSVTYKTEKDEETDALQRLIALGLIIEDLRASNMQVKDETLVIDTTSYLEKKERLYSRTSFGKTLVQITSHQ